MRRVPKGGTCRTLMDTASEKKLVGVVAPGGPVAVRETPSQVSHHHHHANGALAPPSHLSSAGVSRQPHSVPGWPLGGHRAVSRPRLQACTQQSTTSARYPSVYEQGGSTQGPVYFGQRGSETRCGTAGRGSAAMSVRRRQDDQTTDSRQYSKWSAVGIQHHGRHGGSGV